MKAKRPENRRELNVESAAQRKNISVIRLIWRIGRVAAYLEFRRLALDRFVGDYPLSFKRANLEWQASRTINGYAGPVKDRFAEIDQMYVNGTPTPVNQHPVESVVHAMGAKSRRFHGRRIRGAISRRDRYVEIFVLAALMTE